MSASSQHQQILRIRERLDARLGEGPDADARRYVARLMLVIVTGLHMGVAREKVESGLADGPGADTLDRLAAEQALLARTPAEPRSPLDRFLAEHDDPALPLGLRYLHGLADSEPVLWDVVATPDAGSIGLRPVGTEHAPIVVAELAPSGLERPPPVGARLLARLVAMPHGAAFGGAALTLPPEIALPGRLRADELVEVAFARWAEHRLRPLAGRDDAADAEHEPARRGGAGRTPPREPDSGPDRDRVIERVRKLYAMAQETEASPHEAEIALRRCQSLMAKFGIAEADLETSDFGSAASPRRTVAMHVRYLGSAIAALHDVLFVTGGRHGVEFRGYAIDVQAARLTLEYLEAATERALASRRRGGRFPAGRSAAYDYRVSFAAEVYRRVDAMVAERKRHERAASSTGTALTVRKREIVERECGEGLRTRSTTHRSVADGRAAAAGRADGARVSLDPQVEAGSGAPRLK